MPDGIRNDRQIATWLLCVCAAIFIMLIIGGATRLTHSGLSMMTWDPLMGWIPPLNDAQWQESFDHYKKIPEFYELNPDMNQAAYKGIFLLEYVHRVWGRLIGMLFLIPFLYFVFTGKISKPLRPKMVTMFVLGGLQGLMGWYMVSSGFDNPHVSQYRLTSHLLFAFIIYSYILWVAMGLLYPEEEASLYDIGALRRYAWALSGLIFITVTSGGFVAGLKAGFAYNTFPLMDGQLIPDGLMMLSPWYANLFENIVTVQFDHRTLAETLLLLIVGFWFYARRFDLRGRARLFVNMLLGMGIVQLILGISTLLLVVPVWLGVTHQGGAMVLFSIALFLVHSLRQPQPNG